jgi:hypothetical protein
MEELFNFYHLDECSDLKSVKKRLSYLQEEGKIEYSIDGDILKIKDLDLDETDIKELMDLLDECDVFPYPDYNDEIDEDYNDFYDNEEDNI